MPPDRRFLLEVAVEGPDLMGRAPEQSGFSI